MQVTSKISYGSEQFNAKERSKHSLVKFKANPVESQNANKGQLPVQGQEDKKQKGMTFKKATNILGVVAWFAVVGYSYKKLKPGMISDNAKDLGKQALSFIEKAESKGTKSISDILGEDKNIGSVKKKVIKTFYNIGDWFQNKKMKMGSELFTNVTYAFGTLFVMPAVVLFSPFGKKKSSAEDKTFAVLRQPLSVAATLGMQFTFDKLIDKYVPEVLKKNHLEDASILDENGKIKSGDEFYDKIKYNKDDAEKGFKEFAKKGLFKDDNALIDDGLFKRKSFEEESASHFEGKLKDILNDKYKKDGLNLDSLDDIKKNDIFRKKGSFSEFKKANPTIAEAIEDLLVKFKKYTNVLDNNKMAVQKSKTWVNVTAASIIGCTFLNVIYGKSMKAYKNHKNDQLALQKGLTNDQNKEKEVK